MTDEATRHNQTAYDKIAPGYARRQASRKLSFPDLMDAFTARLSARALVADLGCGPGHDGARIVQAGHRVVGVDRSAAMLRAQLPATGLDVLSASEESSTRHWLKVLLVRAGSQEGGHRRVGQAHG